MATPNTAANGINQFERLMMFFMSDNLLGNSRFFEEPIQGLNGASQELSFNVGYLKNLFPFIMQQASDIKNNLRQARPNVVDNPLTADNPGSIATNLMHSFKPMAQGLDRLASTAAWNNPDISWQNGSIERARSHGSYKNIGLVGQEMGKALNAITGIFGMISSSAITSSACIVFS